MEEPSDQTTLVGPRELRACRARSARVALSTKVEQRKIAVLLALRGVNWPTASVLLHFGSSGRYPILDVRALWSLGNDRPPPSYGFDQWWAYTETCRRLAREAGVTMRELDRALWQYSKEHARA